MIYMDAAATAPADQQILQTVWPLLTNDFGNPSSRHELGASAARAIDYARTTAASALAACGGRRGPANG